MKINNKFIKAERLGEKLAYKICQGYDITIEIFNEVGDGRIILEHDDYITTYVDFSEINKQDKMEIGYNNLGTIVSKLTEG